MSLRILLTVVCVCLATCFTVSQALAQFEIHPRITLEQEYTDNLFLTNEDEEEDWILTVEPGISLGYASRTFDVTLDYSLRFKSYVHNDQLDSTDFEGAQRADLATTLFRGRPFTLGVSGSISRETLDERENSNDANELINKSTQYDLSINPQYRLRLGDSFSLVFGYIYDRTDHEDPRGIDYQEHTGRVSLVKQLSTNTEISANYSYMMHQSEDEDEYDEQSYTLGLNQQLGPRTRIGLEGGYSIVEFDNGLEEDTTTWLVDVSYKLSGPLTLSLFYSQDFTTSAIQGITKQREARLAANYAKESLSATAELFWDSSEYFRTMREDEAYGSRFRITIPLARNLSTNLDAEYEKAQFDDVTNEKVDRYSFGVSFDYVYRRFLVSLEYEYDMDDSDINVNDYQSNTVTLRTTLRF